MSARVAKSKQRKFKRKNPNNKKERKRKEMHVVDELRQLQLDAEKRAEEKMRLK